MIARIARSWMVLVAAASLAAPAQAQEVAFRNPFAPSPPPPSPELGAPRVHIDSDFPITLHRAQVNLFVGQPSEILCQAPCDTIVDGRQGDSFYFAGDEIPKSQPFRLIEKSGDVIAHVSPGNRAALKVGNALILPTVITLVAGATLIPFAALSKDLGTGSRLETATIATLSVGVASLVTTIALIVAGKTRFDFERRVGRDGVRF